MNSDGSTKKVIIISSLLKKMNFHEIFDDDVTIDVVYVGNN